MDYAKECVTDLQAAESDKENEDFFLRRAGIYATLALAQAIRPTTIDLAPDAGRLAPDLFGVTK